MSKEQFSHQKRALRNIHLSTGLAIVGGGISGICAAISTARAGIKVVLIQDRPVLGGNASSEVRLWILGATSHMGNNNRWAREGGIIDEILVENTFRNKEGNPVLLDALLLEKVKNEPNITLLLNTAAYDIEKRDTTLTRLFAFCSQNETFYEIEASLFCDASGDGIIAYQAGASYRMGAEDKLEMNEHFAPDQEYGGLLGHSIYFYSKDTGKPVKYIAPEYALKDISKIPRYGNINAGEHGCKFWWLEYGGRLNTIHDTEDIKWELWSVVYGVWDYIKNSGKFNDVENLTLEWVGTIPGKRESRRFEGMYMLKQDDIIHQKHFEDAVAFGGWAIDLHPADGVFSEKSGCNQFHAKGIYEIPLRCYISKDITNLFYAGRNISTSHVAHGSSRVMATSAHGAQAVGIAAAYSLKNNVSLAGLILPEHIKNIQNQLNIAGQSIPNLPIDNAGNKISTAKLEASGTCELKTIPFNGEWLDLTFSVAQMLPMEADTAYEIEIAVDAVRDTQLYAELRSSEKPCNHTPENVLEQIVFNLESGCTNLTIPFKQSVPSSQYGYVTFLKNQHVKIKTSANRYTGILSLFNKFNLAVNNHGKQIPPANSGFDAFEFWCPERRPEGQNIAMNISPAIHAFGIEHIAEGFIRPTIRPNTWVASLDDPLPEIKINWNETVCIHAITIYFDTDSDHPMESVQMGHPEDVMPFCIRNFRIKTSAGELLHDEKNNYQTIRQVVFNQPVNTNEIIFELEHPSATVPASMFYIYVK